MAAFFLDHNISVHLAGPLGALGHSSRIAYDVGLDRAEDPEVLAWAARHQHVVVTHNADDFEMLHLAWRLWSTEWAVEAIHAGIVVVRQSPDWSLERTSRELDHLVRKQGPLTNQYYRFRLPDGWLVEN